MTELHRLLVRWSRVVAGVGVTLLTAGFCTLGWLGADTGHHWDEWYHTAGLLKCIQKMTFFPQDFIYHGLYFLLGAPLLLLRLGGHAPAIIRELGAREPSIALDFGTLESVKAFQAAGTELLSSNRYAIEARTWFSAVSSLAIVWVFLALRRLFPGRAYVALAGAAFLAGSWQFQYHAHMIAIDAPLAQFLALQFLLGCYAWQTEGRAPFALWLMAMGAAGGLVLGCKATGVFALIPVALLPWLRPDRWRWHQRLALMAAGTIAFGIIAFATTPGMVLDLVRYLETMRHEAWDYGRRIGPDHPHFVAGLPEHLWRVTTWLAGAVGAPSLPRALAAAAVAVAGAVALGRRHRRLMVGWAVFVVVAVTFVASHRLLIIRHYVTFVPLMAIAFGAGVAFIADRIADVRIRAALVVLLVAGVGFNLRWQLTSALSLRRTTPETIRADLERDLSRRPRPVRLSPAVRAELSPAVAAMYRCQPAATDVRNIDAILVHANEHDELKANRLLGIEHVYDSRELDHAWYPSWDGHRRAHRLLRIRPGAAASLGLRMAEHVDCVPGS